MTDVLGFNSYPGVSPRGSPGWYGPEEHLWKEEDSKEGATTTSIVEMRGT